MNRPTKKENDIAGNTYKSSGVQSPQNSTQNRPVGKNSAEEFEGNDSLQEKKVERNIQASNIGIA